MKLDVEKKLEEKNIAYKIFPLSAEAFTVPDVVKYSNHAVKPEEICKTIIVKTKKTNKIFAFMLKGEDRLSFSKAKKILGEELTTANPKEVKEASEVEPGAVCPFLLHVPLYVDKKVLELKNINCGSGHHLYELELKSSDLTKGIDFTLCDITKENLSV